MPNSQNGWPASGDRDEINVKPFNVGGADFPGGVRSDYVADVLRYVAEQFHNRVENLVDGWCWGYNYRTISGSNQYSNHASGTAIDCNAPNHPYGQSGTFSSAQEREIGQILNEVSHVVRWGGEYADEMHFEINASYQAVKNVALNVRGSSSGSGSGGASGRYESYKDVAPGDRVIYGGRDKYGTWSRGSDVEFVQNYIGTPAGSADGYFGPNTHDGVRWYQDMRGITVDGEVGPETWHEMGR